MGQVVEYKLYGQLLQDRYDRERDKIVAEQRTRAHSISNRIGDYIYEALDIDIVQGAEGWPVDEKEWNRVAISTAIRALQHLYKTEYSK